VGEHLAGFHTENGGFGHARVCAAQPEDLRSLSFRACREELWIFLRDFMSPFVVALKRTFVCVSY
jgi:hypothetical protein